MGIEYQISLSKIAQADDGDKKEILATLSFDHGDDLYDCEDYNEVGGLPVDQVGNFAILNPSGAYTSCFLTHVLLEIFKICDISVISIEIWKLDDVTIPLPAPMVR